MSTPLLLRTPPPYEDESFAGYLIRLAQSNYYSSPNWILQLAGLPLNRIIHFSAQPNQPSRLSQLLKLSDEQLKIMILASLQLAKIMNPVPYNFYQNAIALCPLCLLESPYCRQVWDWNLAGICDVHQCLLIRSCVSCQKKISWVRSEVTRCRCGFDFCHQKTKLASLEQLKHFAYMSKLVSLIN
jgi:hypothetical protein